MTGWLEGALTTTALCWRLERTDGVTIGLTAHDRELIVEGLRYRAAPGMTPSSIRRGDRMDADDMEASGPLSMDAIGETDLLAGRWDGARITVLAVDWTRPAEPLLLGEGRLGAVETADGAFTAELRGAAAALEQAVVEETSPGCRAHLGDRRCRVPMAGRRRFARVVASEGRQLTLDRAEPVANAYGAGRLRWFGGANAGLESAVAASDGATLTLERVPPLPVAGGELLELVEGCDKRLETCAGRFANAINFRGEPYLPGIDLLTRYPGA
ncbi:DUF2163 domain-containing protein [Sphingomonas desiccabilis]|uniref:DUF2163 domain-containing protein n=1 Tax=Sphingomonas desiccabilis TaxID=429134 RepID=A0A4Q2ITB0_9SPHN|nr:DUF2163 domain-containing protein [Sphingomonas desiccabilis]MBB3911883.1 putative phage protein (TIGR02218 family) [Sphingomonas desiccabilis]RXZ31409.1 DUF2163 domain-containing protein [Sphingomonas desiccabilis]